MGATSEISQDSGHNDLSRRDVLSGIGRRRMPYLKLVAFLTLLTLALLGINYINTRILPYFSQYDIRVVLEPGGRPLNWDSLERVYGHDIKNGPSRKEGSNQNRRLKSTAYRVPNIIHFVTFGQNRTFSFLNYLSVLSAYQVQNPDAILFHHDYPPVGMWWEKCIKDVPILQMIKRERPKEFNGRTIKHVFHASDIARIEVLLAYGGMYIDYDVILIQPLDELRQYPCTMGKEKPPKLISGIIIAEKGALFLQIWLEIYRHNYVGANWDYNSGSVPYYIYTKHPKLIHLEKWRLTTPDWTEREQLFKDNIEWRDLYLLHMMFNKTDHHQFTPESIKTQPGIIGSVMRNAYYGNPNMILKEASG